MLSVHDPRPYDLLISHYQSIATLKSRLQVAYFGALKNRTLHWLLSPSFISISSEHTPVERLSSCIGSMVWGGMGSKVKIFNLKEEKIVSILKDGYDNQFFFNEIEAREKFQNFLPIPTLISVNKTYRFFEEKYHDAAPVQKLNNQTWPLLVDLLGKIFTFYQNLNPIIRKTEEYQKSLISKINDAVSRLPSYNQANIIEIKALTDTLYADTTTVETILVQSHGDFWLGNVLLEKSSNSVLLVDWERTNQYSLLHDIFTLLSVYCLEQGDFQYFEDFILLNPDSKWVHILIENIQDHFRVVINREFLNCQMILFLLERLNFALTLPKDPTTSHPQTNQEFDKWCAFIKAIREKGLLTISSCNKNC
jgi:hypothetical protein